ncbi:MAG: endonuclease/exonuclease/phosphatase family protein [Woeseiaceae bacterium]
MNREIRVLSCNLYSGRADPGALLGIVERDGVDIVCAQELSRPLAAALSRHLPYGDVTHEQIVRGNGIASRFPVDISRIRMPKRDGFVAALSPQHWGGLPCPIEIVNVHISGPHLWPYFPHPVCRHRQLEALLAERAARVDVPHAILGDFNSSPIWTVYRRMAARYVDAMAASGTPRNTWPRVPALGIRGLLRIDHCFLRGLAARATAVVELPGSDHFGLRVDLVVDETAP